LDVLAAPKLTDCTHQFCGACIEQYFDSVGGGPSAGSDRPAAVRAHGPPEQVTAAGTGTPAASLSNDSALPCSHVVVTCPSCRDVVSTCTFERTLDRDLAKLVDDMSAGDLWEAAPPEEQRSLRALQDEWHSRRSRYQASAWHRACSGKALKEKARAARARAAVSDGFAAYEGREGRFLDAYYAGPARQLDEEDDELYDYAAKFVLPLAAAVLLIVMMSRQRPPQ